MKMPCTSTFKNVTDRNFEILCTVNFGKLAHLKYDYLYLSSISPLLLRDMVFPQVGIPLRNAVTPSVAPTAPIPLGCHRGDDKMERLS